MNILDIFQNKLLLIAVIAWALAQILKLPLEFLRTGKLNWAILLSTGGMPSSHSTLVTAMAHIIGLTYGFDTGEFALAFVVAVVVIYDATGIRRQAGRHAALINAFINDLASGHPIKEMQEKRLKEVLGHTPLEAAGGVIWGLLVSTVMWLVWY